MKLALVNGERRGPSKGLIGSCIGCAQPMIPKCGPIKIHHWAHKSDCECDHWWENETEWHRAWKNHFPSELQEIRHQDETTGEWHIADVKTKQGHILEFQHSFLKDEERQARNKFYGDKLVWVVDGLKRVKDKSQFELFLKHAIPIKNDSSILKLHPFIDECALINEWSNCGIPVFFDFGPDQPLWCLLPKSIKGNFYILEYSRQNFVALHTELLNGKTFEDFTKFVYGRIIAYENPELVKAIEAVQAPQQTAAQAPQQAVVQMPRIRYARISLNDLRWLERQVGRMPKPRNNNKKFRRL